MNDVTAIIIIPIVFRMLFSILGAGGEVTGEMTSAGTGEYFFLCRVPFMKLIETAWENKS